MSERVDRVEQVALGMWSRVYELAHFAACHPDEWDGFKKKSPSLFAVTDDALERVGRIPSEVLAPVAARIDAGALGLSSIGGSGVAWA